MGKRRKEHTQSDPAHGNPTPISPLHCLHRRYLRPLDFYCRFRRLFPSSASSPCLRIPLTWIPAAFTKSPISSFDRVAQSHAAVALRRGKLGSQQRRNSPRFQGKTEQDKRERQRVGERPKGLRRTETGDQEPVLYRPHFAPFL